MREETAVWQRQKKSGIYPLGGDRFLIEATLRDEIHDVIVEVEVIRPSLEIVAARSEIRNGPFTNVCNMTQVNMEKLVGMRVGRGFTQAAPGRGAKERACWPRADPWLTAWAFSDACSRTGEGERYSGVVA